MTAPPDLVCIDLDGTLEDSRDDMVASVHRVRSTLRLKPLSAERVRGHVHRGMAHLYRACFSELLGPESAPGEKAFDDVRGRYEADYLEHIVENTELYPGIDGALLELEGRARLACVTNKPEALSRALLHELGIGDRFVAVVGGDTCAQPKPHPMMIDRAVVESGHRRASGRIVMVGDSAGDVKLAHAASVKSVWCGWGYAEHHGDELPDEIAETPDDLVEAVGQALEW